ncbi:MAG: SDR family oxidoreductase [gamma proteobacterium symbiont of Phacoides pectinatus]
MLQCAGRSRDERRTVGAVTAVALASRFWGLGCPKIFHEVATHLPAYRLSKCALNAVTRIYAAELGDRGITINSVCPGWVRTDMGGPAAQRDVSEGVETTLWLATMENPPSGGFFRDKAAIPW